MYHQPPYPSMHWILIPALLGGVGLLDGCQSITRSPQGASSGAAVSAGMGTLAGNQRGSALIGGAIGATSGGANSDYMDRQAGELERVADTARSADGIVVTIRDRILFDADSTMVKPSAASSLDRLASVLRRYPKTTITVAGHTDNTGRPDENVKRSERQAQAVKFALIDRGVDAGRISAIGFGAKSPVASNSTPDGREENRRVELHIVPDSTLEDEAEGKDG